jgi:DNA gyrase subunit A
MAIIDTFIDKETKERYLTYAMSVVTGRAIPDVRDGLKPVQRRILYAMYRNLSLRPESGYRKSAAVVGEVLARFHPHGDIACYDAMVRMAQDFSLRYPLVDGQGNFGSLDGDNAAAYRYTEAKLLPIAMQVIGEIDEETVDFRDNFDATAVEPVVLPSRVPNLLVNGASGIAVGMATNIPPHNLKDTIRAIIETSRDPDITIAKLTSIIKGPDFPTGCLVLNSKKELEEIYRTGKGSIKMRSAWTIEEGNRGKQLIIVNTIPYGVNKSVLVEKIADIIIQKKAPQLVDVRDESTDEIRIVIELAAGADAEIGMVYLFKNTQLESTFPINFTVLVPVPPAQRERTGLHEEMNETLLNPMRPELINLKQCIQEFFDFRLEVTEKRLQFELKKLLERIHVLEGLALIYDHLDEVIKIIRASEGRSDSALKLRARFKLTEIQSFAVVDMRLYNLSKTNIKDVRDELKAKQTRAKEINKILSDKEALQDMVRSDLESISEKFGDKRKSQIVKEFSDVEFNEEHYVVNEDVYAIITKDGWVKRIRQTNELSTTRLREGDAIMHAHTLSTKDSIALFTNTGTLYSLKVKDLPTSSGFGTPLQKLLKFKDNEQVVESFGIVVQGKEPSEQAEIIPSSYILSEGEWIALISQGGIGFSCQLKDILTIKKSGRKAVKLKEGDMLAAVCKLQDKVAFFTEGGYALSVKREEILQRELPSLGVSLISLNGADKVIAMVEEPKSGVYKVAISNAKIVEKRWGDIFEGHRSLKGKKIGVQGEIVRVYTE